MISLCPYVFIGRHVIIIRVNLLQGCRRKKRGFCQIPKAHRESTKVFCLH